MWLNVALTSAFSPSRLSCSCSVICNQHSNQIHLCILTPYPLFQPQQDLVWAFNHKGLEPQKWPHFQTTTMKLLQYKIPSTRTTIMPGLPWPPSLLCHTISFWCPSQLEVPLNWIDPTIGIISGKDQNLNLLPPIRPWATIHLGWVLWHLLDSEQDLLHCSLSVSNAGAHQQLNLCFSMSS